MNKQTKKSGCAGTQTPTEVKNQDHFTTNTDSVQEILGKEAVAIIKESYPRFDHSLWSKCKRPDLYGVQLVHGARKLIEPQRKRKSDRRTKEHRWMVRFTKATHSRLQTAMTARGITSKQTFIEAIVLKWLEENDT